MAEIRLARTHEVDRAAEILAAGLGEDVAVQWPAGRVGDHTFGARVFELLARASQVRSWLWVVGDVQGAASWVPPSSDPDQYDSFLADTEPDLGPMDGPLKARYDAFWAFVDGSRPVQPHWYLDFVAVHEGFRRRGLGTALVDAGVSWASRDGVPAFLMTTIQANVAYYEHRGFVVTSSGPALNECPQIWFMTYSPGS